MEGGFVEGAWYDVSEQLRVGSGRATHRGLGVWDAGMGGVVGRPEGGRMTSGDWTVHSGHKG